MWVVIEHLKKIISKHNLIDLQRVCYPNKMEIYVLLCPWNVEKNNHICSHKNAQ